MVYNDNMTDDKQQKEYTLEDRLQSRLQGGIFHMRTKLEVYERRVRGVPEPRAAAIALSEIIEVASQQMSDLIRLEGEMRRGSTS